MQFAVTGSTGGFGALAISHMMMSGVDPSSIVALARSEEKASDLKKKGVNVRIGNYEDQASLDAAFVGVDRILLVSSSEVGKRLSQHQNVIEAAQKAGVSQIVYTSITQATTSTIPLAPEHKGTEEILKDSGVGYVILRNNWYTENYMGDLQYARQSGVIAAAAGQGKVASASKTDYAEAAARVLTGGVPSGTVYELSGPLWDYNELARASGRVLGRDVQYQPIEGAERKQALLAAGLDEGTAGFYSLLEESIAEGTLEIESRDLKQILGRDPLSLEEGLKNLL